MKWFYLQLSIFFFIQAATANIDRIVVKYGILVHFYLNYHTLCLPHQYKGFLWEIHMSLASLVNSWHFQVNTVYIDNVWLLEI